MKPNRSSSLSKPVLLNANKGSTFRMNKMINCGFYFTCRQIDLISLFSGVWLSLAHCFWLLTETCVKFQVLRSLGYKLDAISSLLVYILLKKVQACEPAELKLESQKPVELKLVPKTSVHL